MDKPSLPAVGFDRFVKLSWAEYALDLALTNGDSGQLRPWLGAQIDGDESARKTFNLLNNLWVRPFPETEQLRTRALALTSEIPQSYRIILHWGMALANFELFQQTTSNMGKLLRLQGSFNSKEIQQRMAEGYSNQGTIPRAVSRIVQSICDWGVIQETDKHTYEVAQKNQLMDEDLLSWLLQAALNRKKNRPVSVIEILRLPELFPFEFTERGRLLLHESPVFTIIREGLNQEYIVLT